MFRWRKWVGLAVGVAVVPLFWLRSEQRPTAAPPAYVPASTPASPKVHPLVIGAVGCSAQSCHGGPVRGEPPLSAWGDDATRWTSSATVWRMSDPHRHAYAVLTEEPAEKIESLLPPGPDGKRPHAKSDRRCLVCHTTPILADGDDERTRALRTEGVGCEACHGSAGKWLDSHTKWNPTGDCREEYKSAGMTPLFDVAVRAETCANCHVGSARGDVNHDLIAAGHPRLNFDYATFVRMLPPHWTEKDRTSPTPLRPASEQANHWRIGRAVCAEAAFYLLAERAKRAEPWPEFAEANCYACHHQLAPEPWRGRGKNPKPGSMPWNEPPLLRTLLANDPATEAVDKLANTMARNAHDRKAVERDARDAAWKCRAWADKAVGADFVNSFFAALADSQEPMSWDKACDAYYALLALDPSPDARTRPEMMKLRTMLICECAQEFDPVRLRGEFLPLFRQRAAAQP